MANATATTASPGTRQDPAIRIATQFRARLVEQGAARFSQIGSQAGLLQDQLATIAAARRKLALCVSKGWLQAAQRVLRELQHVIRDIPYRVNLVSQIASQSAPPVPTLREVVAELMQLEEEFEEVRYDPKAGTISAVTEPIELEGIHLGPFEIRLEMQHLSSSHSAFRVIPMDPNWAAPNESVCHPHVSDEHMCTGDAGVPIREALQAGRLADFFMIVRGVLRTYNSGSPYVSLDSWTGQSCNDCGYVMHDDDTYYCGSCNGDFCGDCSSSCSNCGDSTCLSCLRRCSVCEDNYCPGCMTTCPECDQTLCKTCLEERQCSCHEEEEEDTHHEDDNREQGHPEEAADGTQRVEAA